MRKILWLLAAVIALTGASQKAEAKKPAEPVDSVKVLFIGNSFTFYNDMPKMVDSLARKQKWIKNPLAIESVVKGGQRLSGHLADKRLYKALDKGDWDFVVVREQSSEPALSTADVIEKVYPNAQRLDSLIKATNPKAKVVYYMTWGHKYGFREDMPDYPMINTYEGMQERLITTYLEMTYANDGICAPVGMAWRTVRHERPNLILYKDDSYHPSKLGSYLAANVIFTTMFLKPYQSGYYAGYKPEVAEYIQQVAQKTVFDNLRLLNIEK